MRTPDNSLRLSRRGFLQSSAASTVAVGAISTLVQGPAWAAELKSVAPDAAPTLLRMIRDMYPHDRLADSFYVKALATIDVGDDTQPRILDEGAEALNAAARKLYGKPYVAIKEEADRVAALKSIEATPFFQKVRSDMVTALYNQPEVWTKLGYEGPSAHKGGYLHRGFNDIDWLDEI